MAVKKLRKKSPCYCANLRKAASAVTEHYNVCLSPCGITVPQFSLLRNLQYIGASTITELAEQVELERSTLARTLKPLMAAGYIEDLADAGTRNRRLQISADGEALLVRAALFWKKAQTDLEQVFGEKQLVEFMKNLRKLGDL
ncbi:MarR family winged helix-turn-helix transcriptional regulator [Desulfosarcina sp. OttesenSCG-928-A07]|nr:MarR family winged helix-turn-helix transcriptional regulator [Desulfosarcina sp. OttesenSCG-928-G17]MDL2328486.1 MarR family winged helix-turn-helix transcriptional regulator [Desulfosarcina sp. OttesenSCG-928-A07]